MSSGGPDNQVTGKDSPYCCIVFLENGEIREMGAPKVLLDEAGRFADFWREQEMKEFVS